MPYSKRYRGVCHMKEGMIQFNTVFVSEKTPKDPRLGELNEWCAKFQKNYLTPVVEGNYTGNLSFQVKRRLCDNCFQFEG